MRMCAIIDPYHALTFCLSCHEVFKFLEMVIHYGVAKYATYCVAIRLKVSRFCVEGQFCTNSESLLFVSTSENEISGFSVM